jgi:hypothetical protein
VRRLGLILALSLSGLAPPARAGSDEPAPYRLWWSFPRDDLSAIEIDDPDLRVSEFPSKWAFASKLASCDPRKGQKLLRGRAAGEGTPLRELRIESLDAEGKVHATSRCVMPLVVWRTRLGKSLAERLEDELDAHLSFLVPRKVPKAASEGPKDAGP